VRLRAAQNPLHDLIVCTRLVQIACDPATETAPPVPGQPKGLNRWTNDALGQLIHIQARPIAIVKHHPSLRIVQWMRGTRPESWPI
jgi:hypothetical protein